MECYSGYRVNERPVSFTLMTRQYKVLEVIDRWYGEACLYFKIKADDDNIYLLKYEEWKDNWDLVFYQNPRKLESVPLSQMGSNPHFQRGRKSFDPDRYSSLH